ncbi:MAG: hypothetical protein KatS3mg104_2662 [Phycisphaerae bacterium]|nr:MAG: hypothetical protein KatS3mg104_2662 [Phycisphaerae bacterium]
MPTPETPEHQMVRFHPPGKTALRTTRNIYIDAFSTIRTDPVRIDIAHIGVILILRIGVFID